MRAVAGGVAIIALAVAGAQGCGPRGLALDGADRVRASLPAVLNTFAGGDRDLTSFYQQHGFRPLWVRDATFRPEARQLMGILAGAAQDGLDPRDYDVRNLAGALNQANGGHPAALARTEIRLSRAYARYVVDLHRPAAGAGMIYTDPATAPPMLTGRQVLEAAADARSLRKHLVAAQRMNPLYEELRSGLSAYRARWSRLPQLAVAPGPVLAVGAQSRRVHHLHHRLGLAATPANMSLYDKSLAEAVRRFQQAHGVPATGSADARTIKALNAGAATYERLILANLDRARALPSNPGRRFILVDAAAARLWMYEDERVRDTMRVIVGKPSQQTPAMAGMIRFAVVNPYWNMPPDLARDRLAPRVLREGPDYVRQKRFEILSDWSDAARVLDPAKVNWPAVAAGRQELRVRQLPGPDNSMGAIKFMMPNHLGIYLHDTPDKDLFAHSDRRLSAGCVRVEDAQRLSRWLFRGNVVKGSTSEPEQRRNLPAPVPVYITYLTAAPAPEGVVFQGDVYGRDTTLLAQLEGETTRISAKAENRRVPSGGGAFASR